MSDYDEQAQIDADYARAVNRYNRLVDEHNRLVVEVENCQYDVDRSISIVQELGGIVVPPLAGTAVDTDKEEVIAANVSRTITDLADSYKLLKNGSTASKNLTGDFEKYYTYYGLYNELRQVALGYIVGLDANLWQSDAPRKKVEKMYLANTEYWLAYATMAVMLWASNEPEACERAVAKSMQINERKSSLFFLLASLRFNRIEAAKEWYRVYFDLVETGGIGEEIVYILQVLLCGALGSDVEFGRTVQTRMRELLTETKNDIASRQAAAACTDRYFQGYISVTDKEFLNLKHICAEYPDMIKLLSDAEKNGKLKASFEKLLETDAPLSDRLAERIEDALYALISSNDDAEQELLDQIAYEEAVVKAKGNLEEAQEAVNAAAENKRDKHNLAVIMVNTALGADSKADSRVKKFALDFVRDECVDSANKFAAYRKREKKTYDFDVDGCKLKGDENSFDENKPKLIKYYDGLIKKKIQGDKSCGQLKIGAIVMCVLFVVFAALTGVSFAVGWEIGASVTMIVLAVLMVGGFALCLYFLVDRKKKIRQSFEYRINNGVKMLEDGLNDLGAWRRAYKEADGVHAELLNVLKEVIHE